MTKFLSYPFGEKAVRALSAGDEVSISGPIYTGRDRFHKHFADGGRLPVDFRDGALYHCGPVVVKTKDGGYSVRAAGPTTSSRENPYEPEFIAKSGVRLVIGKGGMDDATLAAMKKHGCVYIQAIGGAGALYAASVKRVAGVEMLKEFGAAEAVWCFDVENFKGVVAMDTHGNSLFRKVESHSRGVLAKIAMSACIALAFAAAAVAATPKLGETEEVKDVFYLEGDDAASAGEYRREMCKMDMRYPKGLEGFPTLVWFHGGGLTRGKRGFPAIDTRRIAVITASYRLLGNDGITKSAEPISDAAAAVAWAFRHIAEYGGDPKKIFVSGMSAGGYLTMMVGMDPQWLAKYGIKTTDLAGIAPDSGQATTHFSVKNFRDDPRKGPLPVIDEWSPMWHCSTNVPPIACITGEPGYEWPGRAEENELLIGTLKALGHKKAWYVRLPYATHGWASSCGAPYVELFVLGKFPGFKGEASRKVR